TSGTELPRPSFQGTASAWSMASARIPTDSRPASNRRAANGTGRTTGTAHLVAGGAQATAACVCGAYDTLRPCLRIARTIAADVEEELRPAGRRTPSRGQAPGSTAGAGTPRRG